MHGNATCDEVEEEEEEEDGEGVAHFDGSQHVGRYEKWPSQDRSRA